MARRVEALALCLEMGWKPSRLYDALELMSKGDSGVQGTFWKAVPRPANAVPLDVQLDGNFVRELLRCEREARALNAAGPVVGHRGEDAAGVGLSLSVEERAVAAIEVRYEATRPREVAKPKAAKQVRRKV